MLMEYENEKQSDSKATILAKIIYEAIIRYTKAKKSLVSDKKSHFRLDSKRNWREDNVEIVDLLEKKREFK